MEFRISRRRRTRVRLVEKPVADIAIAFYLANRADIDAYLEAEEAAFDNMPQPLQTTDPALYNKLMAAKAARQR